MSNPSIPRSHISFRERHFDCRKPQKQTADRLGVRESTLPTGTEAPSTHAQTPDLCPSLVTSPRTCTRPTDGTCPGRTGGSTTPNPTEHQSINQPINQPSSPSAGQSISPSLIPKQGRHHRAHAYGPRTTRTPGRPAPRRSRAGNQSINQSIDHPINQSINHPVNQPFSPPSLNPPRPSHGFPSALTRSPPDNSLPAFPQPSLSSPPALSQLHSSSP